jgi:UDP-N-acetylmuramoyl-tripeptide--D-alanyl-D-alanine ligase
MELGRSTSGITVLNDAYNANPASMEAALRALAHLPVEGRRIAVLGEMRELGAHAPAAHRAIGAMVAELHIDLLVAVGEGGAQIANAAHGVDTLLVADAAAALDAAMERARPGDAVLVKASRAVGLEVVAEKLLATS